MCGAREAARRCGDKGERDGGGGVGSEEARVGGVVGREFRGVAGVSVCVM